MYFDTQSGIEAVERIASSLERIAEQLELQTKLMQENNKKDRPNILSNDILSNDGNFELPL